jgi:site-specific DNA-cytosine methylase
VCSTAESADLARPLPSHEAVAVDLDLLYSADPKPASSKFCKQNFMGKHHMDTIADVTAGHGFCHRHGTTCVIDRTIAPDLLIVGFPCAPFSRMRAGKRKGRWRPYVPARSSHHTVPRTRTICVWKCVGQQRA